MTGGSEPRPELRRLREQPHPRLTASMSPIVIVLDPITGTPTDLGLRAPDPRDEIVIPLSVSIALATEGTEQRSAVGGLEYVGTELATETVLTDVSRHKASGSDETWVVVTTIGDWIVTWSWTIRPAGTTPAVSLDLAVRSASTGRHVLRNLSITTRCGLEPSRDWVVQAPGNRLRPDVRLADLPRSTGISPAGGLRGSSALVAFQRSDDVQLVVWPLCQTEIGTINLATTAVGAEITYETGLAGELAGVDALRIAPLHLDLGRLTWAQTKASFPDWYRTVGLTAPADRPAWVDAATIYEAQVGFSVFWGGHRYEPYPTIGGLTADLDRIQTLGFDTIQLMPRQPYPSYNVHDYADVEISYGPEPALHELIDQCHRRGMRVILDVLLHGVLDQESIRSAADGVRGGRLYASLDAPTGDAFAADVNDTVGYEAAWSRHILDFEPYWAAHSPERTALLEQHPDWFYRDSAGSPTGIYTKAFDASNTEFQDYFIAAALRLVDRLAIDGFRFDAPTYNAFANWSPTTRRHASASPLGCRALFRRLRAALKAHDPELLMYTEPSGVLLRESMDLNYNYDEQWLVTSVLAPAPSESRWTVQTGRDLALWLRDRDAVLPPGSMTAHHIDSHDTFWWPMWGEKWRREQFDLERVAALASLFMLVGGPYMMFTGGEAGLERLLPRLSALKHRVPALARGTSDYGIQAEAPEVFTVTRRRAQSIAVVLVNLSGRRIVTSVPLPTADGPWTDILNPRTGELGHGGAVTIELEAWTTRVLSTPASVPDQMRASDL
jgi:glycosidase